MSTTLQSGRLTPTRKDVVEFISSIEQDRRIAKSAVLVNEAHVVALAKAEVISRENARKLLGALRQIERNLPFRKGVEDVHVLIEDYVTRRVGAEIGGMLNAGKSRNDQVATAIRMTLREALLELSSLIISFEQELLRLAARHKRSPFVGYTHLQPAQPITFAHYLLAVGDAFLRDNQRTMEAYARVNACPMGAGALAGTSFRIDRSLVARLLGFNGIVENSLDAVCSRDFILDALYASSSVALDASRVAEDLIFYSSADVGLVELPDEFASTSSIMPQKKNPDVLEVVRARCAKVVGNYSSATTALHGLTTGYNLDYQELTPLVWDSLDTISSCVKMLTQLVPKVRLNDGIADRYQTQFIAATEIANVLVREEKMPFREAHHAVGLAVKTSIEKGQNFRGLDIVQWGNLLKRQIRESTFRKIAQSVDAEKQADFNKTRGGSSHAETERMIQARNRQIGKAVKQRQNSLSELRRSSN